MAKTGNDIATLVAGISAMLDKCECMGVFSHAMALTHESLRDALFWANMEQRSAGAVYEKGMGRED